MEQINISLESLKTETYHAWENLLQAKGCYISTAVTLEIKEDGVLELADSNTQFNSDIEKQFGDLDQYKTWEDAYIYYTALSTVDTTLEPWFIVASVFGNSFSQNDLPWQRHRNNIVDRLWQMPQFPELVREGLAEIYAEPSYRKYREQLERQYHLNGSTDCPPPVEQLRSSHYSAMDGEQLFLVV